MSKDKKSLIDFVPNSVDNAVKNITDKPTQNIGTTFADIWYLVFGGISHAAEKRKLKYSYALQEFEKELKEKISKIPEDKLIEPDIQIVAPALEASKYCIEKKELRHMFANLIQRSLSPFDAKILLCISNKTTFNLYDINAILTSLSTLLQLGLIYYEQKGEENLQKLFASVVKNSIENIYNIEYMYLSHSKLSLRLQNVNSEINLQNISLTKLGYDFVTTCI